MTNERRTFEIDDKTLRDLNIFASDDKFSLYRMFASRAMTIDGKQYLKKMFLSPMREKDHITMRQESIRFVVANIKTLTKCYLTDAACFASRDYLYE